MVLVKTAFLREAVVVQAQFTEEHHDAGCYHGEAMFDKVGQVDRLEPAGTGLAGRDSNRQAGRRFPQCTSLSNEDGTNRDTQLPGPAA